MRLVFLALAALLPLVAADNGYATAYSQCFSVFTLPTLCVNFNLDTCAHALDMNVTAGSSLVFSVVTDDVTDYSQCNPVASVCMTCLQFSPTGRVLTPSYAYLCPQLVTTCPNPLGGHFSQTTNLGCATLGVDCSQQTSCGTCTAASSSCGWCGDATTGSCMISGINGGAEPYCATCTLSGSQQWVTSSAACPALPNTGSADASSWASQHVGVVVGVPIAGLAVLGAGVAGFVVYRRRRKRSSGYDEAYNQPTPRGAMPLADQSDEPQPPILSVEPAPVPVTVGVAAAVN